ncbi:MAG: NCS2 family permease [Candidatus Dadabacteria bacterium]|nr:NCS2 family permease [Candidatus Dadabacteria bacterium]
MKTLENFFGFNEKGTSLKTETIAGLTTFMTMAYIIFVQPAVLSQAGMEFGAVMMATCISAAVATLIMGIYANYPIGVAPAMGENFFFVFTVVLGMGFAWQKALGAVFISGIIFIVLTIFKIREIILDAVPQSLKDSIAGGIGLFIALIGFLQAGIVEKSLEGILSLGDLRKEAVLLSIFGLIFTAILMTRRITGAILIGIITSTILGLFLGIVVYPGSIISLPPSLSPTLLKLDIRGALEVDFMTVTIVFLFMVMFDTIGTLIGVAGIAGFLRNGKLPRASRALMADAVGTSVGALLGTSTVTAYIESTTGVSQGGRTGFVCVVIAILFLLSIFFYPIVEMIGGGHEISKGVFIYPLTSPALIIVGSLMIQSIKNINWDDFTESLPAFLTLIGIPFTFSIADGICFGFISYPILKLLSGKGKTVSWLTYLLGALSLVRYIFA